MLESKLIPISVPKSVFFLRILFSKSMREIINFSKLVLSKLVSLKIFPKIELMFIMITFQF